MNDLDGSSDKKKKFQHYSPIKKQLAPMAFLDRIGAEITGLRTAKIKSVEDKYPKTVATIVFSNEGDVECDNPDFAPTDDERAKIKEAFSNIKWPEIHPLPRMLSDAPAFLRKASKENVFPTLNEHGLIINWRVRVNLPDGSKSFITITHWSDGEWRFCEADGLQPLHGLDQLKNQTTVFVHEGDKAGRTMREMTARNAGWDMKDKLRAHPWGEELCLGAHLAWPGGANAIHEVDWSPLMRGDITHIYICGDNDAVGQEAVPKIAEKLAGKINVFRIVYSDEFPDAFDLADEFPETLFKEVRGRRQYIGPTFWDSVRRAAWATKSIPQPVGPRGGQTKPVVVLRREWARRFAVVVLDSEPMIIDRGNPMRPMKMSSFRAYHSGFCDSGADVARLLLSATHTPFDAIGFDPSKPFSYKDGPLLVANVCVQRKVKPVKGDIEPWEKLLRHLFQDEKDRINVARWCATLIAKPETRLPFAMILSTEQQGTGKTSLGLVLTKMLGSWNVSTPGAAEIESVYNSWVVHKLLVIANEVYAGRSWKVANQLKSLITDKSARVSDKYVPSYQTNLHAAFLFISNDAVPLAVAQDDRRFFVPAVNEKLLEKPFWADFYEWLEADCRPALMAWALAVVAEHGAIGPGDRPPENARKLEMISGSLSSGEIAVRDLAEVACAEAIRIRKPVLVADAYVLAWLDGTLGKTDFRPQPKILRGWFKRAKMDELKTRMKVGGHMVRCCVANPENLPLPETDEELRLLVKKPAELLKDVEEKKEEVTDDAGEQVEELFEEPM